MNQADERIEKKLDELLAAVARIEEHLEETSAKVLTHYALAAAVWRTNSPRAVWKAAVPVFLASMQAEADKGHSKQFMGRLHRIAREVLESIGQSGGNSKAN